MTREYLGRNVQTNSQSAASIGDVTWCPISHVVYGWGGDCVVGERRLRRTDTLVDVLPVALLRRQTVSPHPGSRHHRQESAGALQWPHRSRGEGREDAESDTRRCHRCVRTTAFTGHSRYIVPLCNDISGSCVVSERRSIGVGSDSLGRKITHSSRQFFQSPCILYDPRR